MYIYIYPMNKSIKSTFFRKSTKKPPMDPYQKKTMATKTRRGRHEMGPILLKGIQLDAEINGKFEGIYIPWNN